MTLDEQLEAFRAKRRELEAAILPLATSLDGRQFSFQASLHELDLQAGGYVMLESNGSARLGQIVSLQLSRHELTGADGSHIMLRHAQGEGAILEGSDRPFHDATVGSATPDEVGSWAERAARPRARLAVGELTLAPGVALELDAGGFDRHTFLCGQSGSGKTYALGLILERLLADNLILMRLNSAADAAFAQAVFSFVPPELVARSATFRLGEALVAGKISSHPALLRFGARVAEEGGADVPATWAAG